MPNNPKPESTPRPPLQATLDTLGPAGQTTERAPQGPSAPPPLPSTTPGVPAELAGLQGYEIVRELGRGGMGVVYLARNKLINRPEVLKVMNKALVGRPEAVDRFLQEIRSAGRLIHANVATTFSAHQVGDLLVLAMEYVEGDDLAKVVRERGALPVPDACFCVRETATALQRAYELDMVHRDIKPSNILLAKQGTRLVVKVIDFGLAKAKSEVTGDRDLTGTNQMMGTPGYTAPEQLKDARSADTRSDIYALGCTLYHLLAGEPPFKGNSTYAVLLTQEAGKVRPLRELRPEVPEGLARLVTRMMAREPAERYAQPAEVAAALAPFVEGVKVPPEGSGELPRVGPRHAFSIGRWPYAVLIGAAAGALLLLAGVVIKLSVKTPAGDALLVVQINQPNADVYVDGKHVTVTWDAGGQRAEVAVKPGEHKVRVKKAGFEAWGETVTLSDGGRKLLTAWLSRLPPGNQFADAGPPPAAASSPPKGSSDKPEEHPVGPVAPPTPGDRPPAALVKVRPGLPRPLDCTGPDGVSAAGVRRAQEAWARYLGRDVEATVEIGNGVTMTFVLVPPGKFLMGSPPDEKGKNGRYPNETLHEVTLTEPFDLGKYEVTQAQYAVLTGKNPSFYKGPDRPVEQVNWKEADAFGRRLTKKLSDGHVYRLPTEAEWEYSCRGGRPSSQPFGVGDGRSLTPRDANFNNFVGETSKVGSYAANALGLYDTHGNVWEWCADWNEPYPDGAVTNPLRTTGGPFRVARGGCHNEPAAECRSALRQGSPEDRRDCWMGFRLARSVPSAGK